VRLIAFALAALLAAPAGVHAQDDAKPEEKKDEKKPEDSRPRRRMMGAQLPIEQLQKTLSLTDEQVTKLKALNEEAAESSSKNMKELAKDADMSKMRELMTKEWEDLKKKAREVLTDEQKTKFDEWSKEQEKNMRRGARAMMGDPETIKKKLYEDTEKDLKLTPDEKKVIMPLVQKVIDAKAEARTNGDKRQQELTAFVRKATGQDDASKAEIQRKLEAFRAARADDQKKVKEAQDALREVVTTENEVQLVVHGILD